MGERGISELCHLRKPRGTAIRWLSGFKPSVRELGTSPWSYFLWQIPPRAAGGVSRGPGAGVRGSGRTREEVKEPGRGGPAGRAGRQAPCNGGLEVKRRGDWWTELPGRAGSSTRMELSSGRGRWALPQCDPSIRDTERSLLHSKAGLRAPLCKAGAPSFVHLGKAQGQAEAPCCVSHHLAPDQAWRWVAGTLRGELV